MLHLLRIGNCSFCLVNGSNQLKIPYKPSLLKDMLTR